MHSSFVERESGAIIIINEKDYTDFRRKMAAALDLIVPEEASEPAHIVKTLEK